MCPVQLYVKQGKGESAYTVYYQLGEGQTVETFYIVTLISHKKTILSLYLMIILIIGEATGYSPN